MCFCNHFSNIFCLDTTSYLQPVQYQTIKFRCLQSAISLKIFKLSTVRVGSWFYGFAPYTITAAAVSYLKANTIKAAAVSYLKANLSYLDILDALSGKFNKTYLGQRIRMN